MFQLCVHFLTCQVLNKYEAIIQTHKNQPGKLSTSLILATFDIKPTDNTILPVNTHV